MVPPSMYLRSQLIAPNCLALNLPRVTKAIIIHQCNIRKKAGKKGIQNNKDLRSSPTSTAYIPSVMCCRFSNVSGSPVLRSQEWCVIERKCLSVC